MEQAGVSTIDPPALRRWAESCAWLDAHSKSRLAETRTQSGPGVIPVSRTDRRIRCRSTAGKLRRRKRAAGARGNRRGDFECAHRCKRRGAAGGLFCFLGCGGRGGPSFEGIRGNRGKNSENLGSFRGTSDVCELYRQELTATATLAATKKFAASRALPQTRRGQESTVCCGRQHHMGWRCQFYTHLDNCGKPLASPRKPFVIGRGISPSSAIDGISAQDFEPSDLLATAIVKRLTEVTGLPVSRVAPIAEDLFALCRAHAWPRLERMAALFFLETNELRFVSVDMTHSLTSTVLVLPLRPIVNALREQLHHAEFDTQPNLAFPPFAVSKGGGR